jgi:hypothetical protein
MRDIKEQKSEAIRKDSTKKPNRIGFKTGVPISILCTPPRRPKKTKTPVLQKEQDVLLPSQIMTVSFAKNFLITGDGTTFKDPRDQTASDRTTYAKRLRLH